MTIDDRRFVFPRPPAFVRARASGEPRRVVLEATDCRGPHLQVFSES